MAQWGITRNEFTEVSGNRAHRLRCQKWKIYSVRDESECYDVRIISRGPARESDRLDQMICEPFPDGEV